MTPADTKTPPPASRRIRALTDFSDRLPPVLVKELRQGLRGKFFVAGFCALHTLLVVTSMDPSAGATRAFWFFLSVMFVFILPSRNLGALGEERQEKTLDTLILTRLTPWRIVWGKWAATASLAALTAVSVLPYLLVRYLNGGSAFLSETVLLLVLLLSFSGLSAIFTAASIIRSPLARNGFAVVASLFVYYKVPGAWMDAYSPGHGGMLNPGSALFFFGILAVWFTLYFLWQAAESIAPLTANIAAPRRLITLAAFVVSLGLSVVAGGSAAATAAHTAVLILLAAGMVELGGKLPPSHIPFVWRSSFRTVAAVFLSPGWGSGFCFMALLCGLLALLPGGGFARGEFPLSTIVSILSAPLVFRLLLPSSMRWGAAPLAALAVLSHVTGEMLEKFFPPSRDVVLLLFPGLHGHTGPYANIAATMWVFAALAVSVPGLVATFRRASLRG